MRRIASFFAVLMLLGLAASGQEQDTDETDAATEDDNGFILNFIENQISGPGREISLSGVEGALSSQARIGGVTVSDDEGPWLEIQNVTLDWNRLALLRGRVNINELSFERIDVLRPPVPVETAPQLEAETSEPFALPDLPVSVRVDSLRADVVSIGEPLMGEAFDFSLSGNATLADGALTSGLQVERLDTPGGTISLVADFANENRNLTLDLDLQEPAGGLLSTLLNIEGSPPLSLKIAGDGPLENVDIDFTLQADETMLADGVLALRAQDDGQGFDLGLRGGIAPLIPATYRDFFAGQTRIDVAGVSKTDGGVRIDLLGLQGAVLTLNGRLETSADNFLNSLNLSGSLGDPAEDPVLLPVPGAETRLNSAKLYINYGSASRWDGIVVLDRLDTAQVAIEDLTFRLGGRAQNLENPETRDVTVSVEGLATGVSSSDPDIASALGNEVTMFVDAALPPGAPIDIRQAQIQGESLSAFVAGTLDGLKYDGRASVSLPDLAILSGIANRNLGGGVTLRADGSIDPTAGQFDLTLDGTTQDVAIGDARVDSLLAGETTISGGALRDETGIRTRNLRIENPQVSLQSDGLLSSSQSDIGVTARVSDLALVDSRFSGALSADARAQGDGGPLNVTASVALPEGRIMDQPAEDIRMEFDGERDGSDIQGNLTANGQIGQKPLDLSGAVRADSLAQAVENLSLTFGATRLTADVSRAEGAPITGRIMLRAPDLGDLSDLAGLDAAGSITADVDLDGEGSGETVQQDLDLQASVAGLTYGGTSVDDLSANLDMSDLLGVPMVEGEINGAGIAAGGLDIASVAVRATREGDDATRLVSNARLVAGTLADVTAILRRLPENGLAAELQALSIRQGGEAVELQEPATVTVQGSDIDLTALRLSVGDGDLTVSGQVSDTLAVDADLTDIPLSIANLIVPDLGLGGSLGGTVDVTGTRESPDVAFDVSGTDLVSGFGSNAGLPPLQVAANGSTSGEMLDVDASITGDPELQATASGQVPLTAEGAFDLAVNLASFPLSAVDQLAGNQGLGGALTAQAQVTGTQSAPEASFTVDGRDLTARLLSENGVPPFAVGVAGAFADNTVTLDTLSATGGFGFTLDGSGTIPLSGDGLNAQLTGVIPLEMASPILAQRAATATGALNVNASATGSLTAPQMSGSINLAGGTFTDPETNFQLNNILLNIGLDQSRVVLNEVRAESSAGGGLNAEGSVSLLADQGFPADINVNLNEIRYTDGTLLSTVLGGRIAVSGPLTGGGEVIGRIDLGKTEISIEEGLVGASGRSLDSIQHLRPPPRVVATLERADVGQEDEADAANGGNGNGLALDIRVSAPNQIFIRGRGLDAEMGGEVSIGGTTSDPIPVGQFDMIRGRLSILIQRLDFTEGRLELDGELDPLINFVAQSTSGDLTAIVTVSGRASDPEITFSSIPEAPEDEVLSQLLFNRAAQDLSPFQLAQLAAAAAELAGVSSGPGVLSSLRSATGLDNLDLVTEEDGTTAVSAGKYIADDVYVDFQTGASGESEVEVVYDLSDYLTARGSVGSDGNTVFGLFFERDY